MADVKEAYQSDKLTDEESASLLKDHKDELKLTKEEAARYKDKRYYVLIEVENVRNIVTFSISENIHGGLDDWLVMESIDKVIC
jgi:hypothetical protein